ncbi:MAG: hypothetical protein K6G28_02320 [Acholeplasmatales bacterium]|nr:hypothetical protein [Acholeplasmatales bacterium]
MKKHFIVVILMTLMFVFCGCSKNKVDWEVLKENSNLLVQNGWTVFREDTQENCELDSKEFIKYYKEELNQDVSFEVVHVLCLNKGDFETCIFYELKSDDQSNYIYNLYSSREGNQRKSFISGKYYIDTNSEEAMKLLGYKFK